MNAAEPIQKHTSALRSLTRYILPYKKEAIFALLTLTIVVGFDLLIPYLVQRIVDEGIKAGNMAVIGQTTLWMIAAMLISAVLAVINNIFSVRTAQQTTRDLRAALYRKVHSLSFANIDQVQTGGLLVRLTSDINQVQQVFLIFMRIGTRAPLLMVGSLILLFVTSVKLALIMLFILPATIVLTFFFARKLQPLFRIVQKRLDRLNTVLQENLSGIRIVKAFERSEFENQRFEEANTRLMNQNIQVMQLVALLLPLLTLVINLSIMIVIWQGGLQVIQGEITIGQIIAFVNYLIMTMFPLGLIAMAIGLVSAAGASANRIEEILEITPAIQNQADAPSLEVKEGRIEFENVSFSYQGSEGEPVLQNISFTAEPGQNVAILGATGTGKTTLLSLIPRLYEIDSGSIRIDGQDIRSVRQESVWTATGIALQETVLFSGTIADNIRFGKPDASMEEVIQAAKTAQAHDFISAMPDGYNAHVEQRGTNLSGGQKQRIAIARALLVRPKILLMDDATSAVDVDTEARIQEALQKLMDECTSLVVAQRISTVLTADKILVLERGQIAARGDHETLLKTSPIYREIFESQLGEGKAADNVDE